MLTGKAHNQDLQKWAFFVKRLASHTIGYAGKFAVERTENTFWDALWVGIRTVLYVDTDFVNLDDGYPARCGMT